VRAHPVDVLVRSGRELASASGELRKANLRTTMAADGGGMSLEAMQPEPIPPLRADLAPGLDRPWDAELGGRLLE